MHCSWVSGCFTPYMHNMCLSFALGINVGAFPHSTLEDATVTTSELHEVQQLSCCVTAMPERQLFAHARLETVVLFTLLVIQEPKRPTYRSLFKISPILAPYPSRARVLDAYLLYKSINFENDSKINTMLFKLCLPFFR